MSEPILVDNDVALKVCCYDCAGEFGAAFCQPQPALILATAPFVMRDRIKRSSRIKDRERADGAMRVFLQRANTVEPDAAEIAMAAEFEELANERGLDLDGGESLLFALLAMRRVRALLTGDKRAIVALEQVSVVMGLNEKAGERVACFEQVMATLLHVANPTEIAGKVCAEPDADKAIAICFRCSSQSFELAAVLDGLASYVKDVRAAAPLTLVSGDDLRALVANEDSIR